MQRIPPHSLQAERAVLGALLLDNKQIDLVLDLLKPEDFYSEAHGRIFEVVAEMRARGQPVDTLTLTEEIDKQGKLASVGGREHVTGLTDTIPVSENTRTYAELINEKALARKLIEAAQAIAAKGYEDYGTLSDYSDFAESSIFQVCSKQIRSGLTPIRETIIQAFEEIAALAKSGQRTSGLATGFTRIDAMTAGMHPGDLIIVAGRPGMGKTSLAMNIAVNASHSRQGVGPARVLVFSLEMPKAQLTKRLLGSEARVDSNRIRTGKMHKDDWPALATAAGTLSELPIELDDTGALSLVELMSKARRAMSQAPLCLIVIDYLQLMKSGRKNDSREQEISEISRGLKGLAKELGIPIIALSQLNRGVEARGNKDKRPQLSDLRESGAIEQDADTIWFVYRDEMYNRDTMDQGIAEVIIGKQRGGATGTVKLRYFGPYTRFENLSEEDLEAPPDVE